LKEQGDTKKSSSAKYEIEVIAAVFLLVCGLECPEKRSCICTKEADKSRTNEQEGDPVILFKQVARESDQYA
jgi:hypothetical protein